MNRIFFSLLGLSVMLSGCYYGYNDKTERNKEFAPNMYNSLAPEPYSQEVNDAGSAANTVFADGLSQQKAPEGTVPRSADSWYREEVYTPFHYENIPEEYERAGTTLTSPLDNDPTNGAGINCSEETFQKGKELYEIYCQVCHGPNGQGKGNLVTSGVFGNVPSYSGPGLNELPEGKMFFTLTYGKGIMGSYAAQLTPKERWEVICYIQQFQNAE